MVGRLRSSARIEARKPLPSSPTRFSAGTRTLSKKIGVLGAPRKPILRSWRPKVMPGIFFGSTMKALMPSAPGPSPVRAITTM